MGKIEVTKKLQQLTQNIVKQFQPEQVILFGSTAWGNTTINSDVDLLIVAQTKNTRELAREIDGFLFPRPFPIDVIVYTPKQVEKRVGMGDFFVKDILTKGQVLYAK